MSGHRLTTMMISEYGKVLHSEERSPATIEKYLRNLRRFITWLKDRPVTKEMVSAWKEHLLTRGYATVTINAVLVSLNGLFRFIGWEDCRAKLLKIQRKMFRDDSRELNKEEYRRLVNTAHAHGKRRLALLMEAVCATGIRISEMKYLTVEAAIQGRAEVSMKGKIRTILIPSKLCRKLLKYAKKQNIASGEIFVTRSGQGISRKQVWAEMKKLCRMAGVRASKVFPHNLRHLFARVFYRSCRDITRLADVLGHSSIETTRIYLISTGAEHIKTLNQLCLVS